MKLEKAKKFVGRLTNKTAQIEIIREAYREGFEDAIEAAKVSLENRRQRHGTRCDCKSFNTLGAMLDELAALRPEAESKEPGK